MLTEILMLLISLLLPDVAAGTQCLSCNDMASPIDCGNVITCGSHQQCFTEFYVTVGGLLRYNLGCRDTLQCSPSDEPGPSLDQSQSDSILTCAQCCNSTLCNSAGCGHQGYPTSRGPICYNCHDQMSVGDCDTITVCGRDEVCMIDLQSNNVSHELRYHTRCELKAVCETQESKWRNVQNQYHIHDNFCHVDCCTEDLCNSKCNNSKTLVTNCHSNPCIHGKCLESQNTYICACENGYTGKNCDIVLLIASPMVTSQPIDIDYCASRPCMHGQCYNDTIKQTFICSCSNGYVGATCNHTVCDSHPCQNGGTCHVHRHHNFAPHYFSCICDVHHEGRLCEIGRILTTASISTLVPTTSNTNNHIMPQTCDNTVCLNGGNCHVRRSDNSPYCRCPPQYGGNRCQVTRHCLTATNVTAFSVNNGSIHFTFVPHEMTQSDAISYCHKHCLGGLIKIDSDHKYKWVHNFLLSHLNLFKTDLWIDGSWNSLHHRWETTDHRHMNVGNSSWITTDWVADEVCVNLETRFHHQLYLLESHRCDALHSFICEYYL